MSIYLPIFCQYFNFNLYNIIFIHWLKYNVYNAWLQWLNGKLCVDHEGGHLPFIGNATDFLKYDEPNLIVVAVNNTLRPDTIPQGYTTYPNNTYK